MDISNFFILPRVCGFALLLAFAGCGDDDSMVLDGGSDATTPDSGGEDADAPDVPEGDDRDGDGLTNDQETEGWDIAVDRIGLGDTVMIRVTSDPDDPDSDDDGLSDMQEYLRTNPMEADTDGDGLSDRDELEIYLSIPTTVDSDGDSIQGATSNPQMWDGDEVMRWGTSPSLPDTDGDNRSDFDEAISNGTNPLVAQVPIVALEFAGEMDVRLNVEYVEMAGTETSYGSSFGLEMSSAASNTDRVATTNTIENSRTVSVSVGVESGWPPSASVSASFSATTTTGFSEERSASVTRSAARTAQSEFQRAQADSRSLTERASTGSLSIGMSISNPSEIAYALTNLTVSVLQWDSASQEFRTVGTLTPEIEEFNLAPGESRAVPSQVSADSVNADLIREFLRDPKSLFFAVSNFDITNADGINYAFLEETTAARTGRVTIDYGDGTVESYRVATNVRRNADGSLAGVPLQTVFDEYLEIPFEATPWDGDDPAFSEKVGVEVLTQVRELAASERDEPLGFWAIFSDVADIDGTYRNFGETVLQRGESLHIAYLRDRDGDGVFDREEDFHGTSDEDEDSDDDGLSDFDEVKAGWEAGVGAGGDYPRQVYSDPLSSDADDDGLDDAAEREAGTDPHNPDTDGDEILDGADSNPLDSSNEPPVLDLSFTVDGAFVEVSGSVTDSSDPIRSVVFDWGDGSSDVVMAGYDAISLRHGYLFPDDHTITITATDDRDGRTIEMVTRTTTEVFADRHFSFDGTFNELISGTPGIMFYNGTSSSARFEAGRLPDRQSFRFIRDFSDGRDNTYMRANLSSFPVDEMSIAFWTNLGAAGVIISQPNAFAITVEAGVPAFHVGNESVSASGGPNEEWNFYVVTREGSTTRFYKNGVFLGMRTLSRSGSSCSRTFIGGRTRDCADMIVFDGDSEDNFFNGRLQDLRVFERTLTMDEINALYGEAGFSH